jgi:hypothetical protein
MKIYKNGSDQLLGMLHRMYGSSGMLTPSEYAKTLFVFPTSIDKTCIVCGTSRSINDYVVTSTAGELDQVASLAVICSDTCFETASMLPTIVLDAMKHTCNRHVYNEEALKRRRTRMGIPEPTLVLDL